MDDESIRFRNYLRQQGAAACRTTVAELVGRSGVSLSFPTAWRVCARVGVKGQRRNASQYDAFWEQIDWRLPDSALAAVWRTDRSNLSKKRRRLAKGIADWRLPADRRDRAYLCALRAEKRRATSFKGPVPRGKGGGDHE